MACPSEINICRVRGDTYPFTVTVKDGDGNPINITAYGFLLTVDPAPDPPDASENLLQLAGVILDGPNGIVQFQPSALDADQEPDTYYYDLQMEDGSGDFRTILKGTFTISQDITK
jgi:hypothetical protein